MRRKARDGTMHGTMHTEASHANTHATPGASWKSGAMPLLIGFTVLMIGLFVGGGDGANVGKHDNTSDVVNASTFDASTFAEYVSDMRNVVDVERIALTSSTSPRSADVVSVEQAAVSVRAANIDADISAFDAYTLGLIDGAGYGTHALDDTLDTRDVIGNRRDAARDTRRDARRELTLFGLIDPLGSGCGDTDSDTVDDSTGDTRNVLPIRSRRNQELAPLRL